MTKYVDAERLKEEIKRQADSYQDTYTDSMRDNLLSFIDSVKHKLDVNLDADIEMEWDSFKKHLAEYNGESEEVVWLNYNSFKELAQLFSNRDVLPK